MKSETFSPCQVGIWRATSGAALTGASPPRRSCREPRAWSILLMNRACGTPSRSSSRRVGCNSPAFAGSGWLAGRLAATADLTATGATQQQMIASLAGAGTLRITDGAIYGFDLAKSLHQIGSLRLANAPTDKTDFTSLTGTYTIKAGVLANNDMELRAPTATVAGAGIVSLPPRSLDYTLQTRLSPGQGVAAALAAVAIPVQITGPWSRPNVQADWSAALNQIKLPGDLGKVAPDINKVLPGIKLPKGLFR